MQLTLNTIAGNSGEQPVTRILQNAIDRVATAGGGTLTIPPGRYLTGALLLPSNFCLHLQAGCELLASPHYADYLAGQTLTVAEQSNRALLYAYGQRNITLCGAGCINGNADAWFSPQRDAQGYRIPARERPRMVVLEDCQQVRLRDLQLINAPMWTVHLVSCQHVFISQLTIDNDLTMANTDALDIDSCQHVHISDSYFSAADDGICLKTTRKPQHLRRPARNITISGCVLRSYSSAFKIGTETVDDIENVIMTGCTIFDSNRAIGLVSRDGGALRRLRFSDISFECRHVNPCHWGRADPIFISCRFRDPAVIPGSITQVSFTGLTGIGEGAINLHSDLPGGIRQVSVSQLQFSQQQSASEQQGSYDVRPPCNPERPTGSGLDNAFLLNPASGEPFGVERYPGGMPALFARGVQDLQLAALTLDRPSPLPAGWHPQPVVQLDSTAI
ncbi:glycoside hydrolase family 28 protein [Pantoea sp. B65]|uniref:glycoside hydrolase family 28 protein n=1 Tax=Pantoea sp. B65 TaxID=2813359 RepID=UPI0039B6E03E